MSEAERTDDLALALRQAIARYAEFLRAFEDLKAQVRTWVSDHQLEFEALRLYLEQFGKLNWKDLDRPLREAELALAEAGWTIPGWMYRKDILELAQQSPPAIDATITARFMSDDGKNLERLRSDLLNAPALAQWHSLIEEAIDSIKAGRHRIAIPAALTILEGFVAGALRSRSVIGRKEKSPISKFTKHKWSDKDINEVFFWESAIAFLNEVFAYSDFSRGAGPVQSALGSSRPLSEGVDTCRCSSVGQRYINDGASIRKDRMAERLSRFDFHPNFDFWLLPAGLGGLGF